MPHMEGVFEELHLCSKHTRLPHSYTHHTADIYVLGNGRERDRVMAIYGPECHGLVSFKVNTF